MKWENLQYIFVMVFSYIGKVLKSLGYPLIVDTTYFTNYLLRFNAPEYGLYSISLYTRELTLIAFF